MKGRKIKKTKNGKKNRKRKTTHTHNLLRFCKTQNTCSHGEDTHIGNVTSNIQKSFPLLEILDKAYFELINNNYDKFINLISQSWDQKKKTSKLILANKIIKDLDKYLSENKSVIDHKLCGAGNGGFFLIFSEKDKLQIKLRSVKINVEPNGVLGRSL